MILPRQMASSLLPLLPLLLNGARAASYNTSQGGPTGFYPCDAMIAAGLTDIVVMPNNSRYNTLVQGAYAMDNKVTPWCFATPRNKNEVSAILKTLQVDGSAGNGAGDWHIAVRSGGHGSDYQNNVKEGVIIDLTNLTTTTYNKDTNIAGVGTGSRWGIVYEALEKHGVVVTGGRESIVGVGGLTLGGGYSWYSGKMGSSCDSVANFEVVLAGGEIVNANQTHKKDLWLSLKGGGNNFGIVTRFDMEGIPAQNLSVARRYVGWESRDQVLQAVVEYTNLPRSNADNAFIAILQYNTTYQTNNITLTQINLENMPHSPAFSSFEAISPTVYPSEQLSQTLSDSANRSQFQDGGVYRSAGAGSLTLINDIRVLRFVYDQYDKIVSDMKTLLGPQNFTTIVDLQPFPAYFSQISVEKGGNALGLDRDPRNKILFVLGVSILRPDSAQLYPLVYQRAAAMNRAIEQYSRSIDQYSEFRYMPYSDASQDIIGSYGPDNVAMLKAASTKYHPKGFFQSRVPGGFKLLNVGKGF